MTGQENLGRASLSQNKDLGGWRGVWGEVAASLFVSTLDRVRQTEAKPRRAQAACQQRNATELGGRKPSKGDGEEGVP